MNTNSFKICSLFSLLAFSSASSYGMHKVVNSAVIKTTSDTAIRHFSQTPKRLWPTEYTVTVNGKIQNDKGTQTRCSSYENYRSKQNSPEINYAALTLWTCFCILLFR